MHFISFAEFLNLIHFNIVTYSITVKQIGIYVGMNMYVHMYVHGCPYVIPKRCVINRSSAVGFFCLVGLPVNTPLFVWVLCASSSKIILSGWKREQNINAQEFLPAHVSPFSLGSLWDHQTFLWEMPVCQGGIWVQTLC